MKKATTFLLLFYFLSQACSLAQETSANNRKTRISAMNGIGFSYFLYDVNKLNRRIHGKRYQFEVPNFRLGLLVEQPISEKLSLKTGLRMGIRTKRKSIYPDRSSGLVYPYSFYGMDEQVSSSWAYFYEVPLSIVYSQQKIRIGAGVLYHGWINILSEGSSPDLGLLPSLSYALNAKFTFGIEYFYALNERGVDYVHDDYGQNIPFRYRNQFVQFTVEYRLK